MTTPAPLKQPRQVRFGSFTVDLVSRELHGSDGKVRLQGLPFQILTILVRRPGEWVTREELRQQLWPSDTFVDFDHSINTAIGKLRRALGDDSEEPQYIETLPRHGYRLISALEEAPRNKSPETKRKYWWRLLAISGSLLAAGLIAGWTYRLWHKPETLTDRDTIVIADIDNRTGDEVFGAALKQALAVELEQSPYLNVLSAQRVSETLTMMGLPADEHISGKVGRELCQRSGSKALLTGSISPMGSHYLIGLTVVACNTGESLSTEQGEAATKEDVLKTLSRATSKLRNKLGESLPSVQKFDVPVEATTSSLEALRYFSIGLTVRHKDGDAAGVPFLRRAIELDPNFASAYSELALSYDNLEQPSRALEAAGKAYELRDRATRKEQLSITALYFNATGELDKEIETEELWSASYPHSPIPRANLGADYAMLGRYEKAVPEQEEALRLEPGNVNVYTSLAASYLYLNRLDDAKATVDLALSRKLDDGGLRQYMYYLAFARGDAAQMQEDVAWAAGKPGDEDLLLSLQSDTEAFYGRIKQSREFTRRAVESALRADSKETAALWHASAAWREAELNNREFSRQEATAALGLSQGRDVQVQAALALARIGDVDRASSLVQQLEKNYPTNLLLKVYWLPSINAAIELSRDNPTKAIAILDTAAPYEQAGGLALYPPYLRGQAYLMSHKPTTALAEFQKLLDHKTIAQNFVAGSLARLQFARAYAMAGDGAQAKAAYQDFFSFWKDADPDLPMLLRAKAEYAKLR